MCFSPVGNLGIDGWPVLLKEVDWIQSLGMTMEPWLDVYRGFANLVSLAQKSKSLKEMCTHTIVDKNFSYLELTYSFITFIPVLLFP